MAKQKRKLCSFRLTPRAIEAMVYLTGEWECSQSTVIETLLLAARSGLSTAIAQPIPRVTVKVEGVKSPESQE